MNCDELRGCYELHALGVLSEPELSEAESHLRRECPQCTKEMRRARETNAIMFASVPEVAPPARLRRRIMTSIGAEPSRGFSAWVPWVSTIAAGLSAVFLFITLEDVREGERRASSQVVQLQSNVSQMESSLSRMQDAVRMMGEPDTTQVTFGQGPQGRVLVNPKRGVLFLASNLPQLPAGKTYELWVIPKGAGAAPRPAGLFQSDTNGNAMHMVAGPIDVAATAAFAVSVEPEAGSPAPTTTPIIIAPVGD
jgi:anti-sigma-K factor RskA